MSVRRILTVTSTIALVVVGLLVGASDAVAWPPGSIGYASINATRFDPGDTAVVTVHNTTPRSVLTMTLTGPDRVLKTGVRVERDGTASISGKIPATGYVGNHVIRVEADKGGEIYPFSVTITGPPDTVPPAPVTDLTAATAGSGATLTWTNPSDVDVVGTSVFRATGTRAPAYGTNPVGTTGSGETSFTDPDLNGRTTYTWSVFARDYSGNVSRVASVTATTPVTTAVLGWGDPAAVDPFRGRPRSVDCPSVTFCVGADGQGNVVRWDGTSWGAPQHLFDVPGLDDDVAVSCPSKTMCVAVAHDAAAQVFDGSTWTASPGFDIRATDVSCVSTTSCLAVSDDGQWSTFDGATWTDGTGGGGALTSVSCAASDRCVGLTDYGVAGIYDGSSFLPLPAGPARTYAAVTCLPASTMCLAAGTDGSSYQLKPTDTWAAARQIPGGRVDALSCVNARFCVAARNGAVVATYDGRTWTASDPGDSPTSWQGVRPADAVSCARTTFCAMAGAGWFRTFQGTALTYGTGSADPLQGGISDVSCATDGFCLAVDQQLNRLTHEAGGSWSSPTFDINLVTAPEVSCVSGTWCLAVRSDGWVSRWTGTGFVRTTAIPLSGDLGYVTDISCGTKSSCVAVGVDGGAATWDGSTWSVVHVEGAGTFNEVSCRAGVCAAVDADGHAFIVRNGVFSGPDEQNGTWHDAVSCGTTRYCLTSDQDGQMWEWNGTTWAPTTAPAGLTPSTISCTGVRTCTVADGGRVATLSSRGWSRTTTVDPAGGTGHVSCWNPTGCALISREGNAVTSG